MQKLISIFLTVLLLASNSGVVLAQHFCGEYKMMEEISFGAKKLSCGIDSINVHAACNDEDAADHDCCDNEYESLSVDEQITPNNVKHKTLLNPNFIAVFTAIFVLDVPLSATQRATDFRAYCPPVLLKDIPVLYESFLI